MRTASGTWPGTIQDSHTVMCRVTSYYDGDPGREVPVIEGQLTYDLTAPAQRRCVITVPLYGSDGFRWDPGADPLHPLAVMGQRLYIELGVVHWTDLEELLPQGFYLVSAVSVDEEAGIVTVQGSDLMQLLQESKIFLSGDSVLPLPTDTHLTAIDKLMYPALHSPVIGDVPLLPTAYDTLPVFTIGGTISLRDGADRIEPITRIMEAWPARMYVDDAGELHFTTPVGDPKTTPDITVQGDIASGTITGTGRDQDRRRPYNAVKVLGQSSTTGAVTGSARAYKTTGPMSVRGPYGFVTRWYQSDMVTSNAQATALASSLLAQGILYGRTERITCVPDARIQLADTVEAVTDALGTFKGLCTSITIPLTSAGGPMVLDITNAPVGA